MRRWFFVLLGSMLCAVAAAAMEPTPAPTNVSFVNDVVPIFTRLGCNQGACHGKGEGQNGFKLSLRGYAPELDHASLTREFAARRVNPAIPPASLLLTKPSGAAPHDGGTLFHEEGRAYEVLRAWIAAGMPGPVKDEARVERLEVTPAQVTLKVNEEQQLTVRAHFSKGEPREVTWLTRFDSNDAGQVAVDSDGKLRVQRPGETAIRASFQGLVSVVLVTAPCDNAVPAEAYQVRNNYVDGPVFAKLQSLRIPPADLCDDWTFLRRLFIDALGMLPTPDEVRRFQTEQRPDKRGRWIDDVLARPEWVDYWTLQLCDLLQNRKERDHDVRGPKGVRGFHAWLRSQVAANRPWNELARDILTVTGDTTQNPAVGYYVVTVGEHREAHKSEVAASVAQAFLGTRIGCAQCHNHPLEKYTQDDYYHFAAFFSRVKLERKESKNGPTQLRVSAPDGSQNKKPVGVTQPRTGQFMAPRPLDRSATTVTPEEDPRTCLAQWITDPGNEYFSGAMVNRLWKHFLGVGLVEPVDDLRASNPPSNPAAWQALNKAFVENGYDLKRLMRDILNSRTYQLSSATQAGNETDNRFYSRYYVRRLPAEVLLDAIAQSSGVPEQFPGYPVGLRAVQLPDPGLKSYFLGLFGRSERVTACACERSGEVTMPQLLHLQNGDSIVKRIASPEGRLATLLKEKQSNEAIAEELFLATVGRKPNAEEKARLQTELRGDPNRELVFRDLFWALLNAKEFAFTH